MSEEQVRPGFLPPRPPGTAPFEAPPGPASERPQFVTQRMESGPRSPLAMAGTIVGAIAILLLVLSFGLGFFLCGVFSLISIMLGRLAHSQIRQSGVGRAGQARAAVWVGSIGLALSVIAAITWFALEANGISGDDLRRWLEERLEEQRARN